MTPEEDEQLGSCDTSIAYIPFDGGLRVMPSKRGRGTLCLDQNECQAHVCAQKALECLRNDKTLANCGVNTTLPSGVRVMRSLPPKQPANSSSALGISRQNSTEVGKAAYFGIFVALSPCDENASCWNSLGSYQCVCKTGFQRYNLNGTGMSTCQGTAAP